MTAAPPAPPATTTPDLRGLWVPVITPFTAADEVDAASLDRLADALLTDGATGLVALGTTGEPATLSPGERRRVVAVCTAACARHGRPLIVGLGTNSTRTTLEEVAHWNGHAPHAAALLVTVPYYTRPTEAGIVEHYRRVARASACPVIVYNVPYRTGRALGADALLALAHTDNIVGVKQAVGVLDRDTLAVLAGRPEGFHVFAGDDGLIAPVTLLGGAGAIAAGAHLATGRFRALVSAALAGDGPTAAALAAELLPIVDAGFAEPSPALWKAALAEAGTIAEGGVRAPMTPATPAGTAALVAAVHRSHGRGGHTETLKAGPAPVGSAYAAR
jgi:4-hydroxy-tetrahydrodipicolinate synthase